MSIPTTAIILAGGKGTRLQSVVSDLPKPLAPVAGRPFLAWQLDHLANQGIRRVILSTGYKAEAFQDQIGAKWRGMEIIHVVEHQPLGTGGAIRWAARDLEEPLCWILNGDTYVDFQFNVLYEMHLAARAKCTLALKQMKDFDRYGTVLLDERGAICGFQEKARVEMGLINAGVYLLEISLLQKWAPGTPFSFERDVLEKEKGTSGLAGLPVYGHFLDIGIPDDYQLAQTCIPLWADRHLDPPHPRPDDTWTLFLDRDGVLNERIPDDYVRRPEQFTWLPGVRQALKTLRERFGTIVIVTNQQGIGKGWMTRHDLESVHQKMTADLLEDQVVLDRIYFCPGLAADLPICRKPLPGMALQGLHDFPLLDLRKSIMVGDSRSDIEFGNRLGMYTVRIGASQEDANLAVSDLAAFADWCSDQ